MNTALHEQQVSSVSLTLDQRVLVFYEGGMRCATQIFSRISRTVKVSKRTIERKVNLLKSGRSLEVAERKERNDKFLTNQIAQEIGKYLEEHPIANASQIIKDLKYNISVRTMRRCLKALGYRYSSTIKEPFLLPQHIEDRMSFAHENIRRRWDNVVFVDECTFLTHCFPKKAYQKPGVRVTYRCPKHPNKLNVWGGITVRGKVALYIFSDNLDGILYRKILIKNLLPAMRRLYEGEKWILAQDNDPKHTCKVVTEYMQENKINVLKYWPASSPDLNPIENVWALMKVEVSKKKPQNLEELEEAIRASWRSIKQEFIENCIQSMRKRLELLLNNDGNKIPY